MQKFLDLKNILSIRLQFQTKVQSNLLNLFTLDKSSKTVIENIDFTKESFAPDLYCLYLEALLNRQLVLNSPSIALSISNDQPIIIASLNPTISPADNYVAKDKSMEDRSCNFNIPSQAEISQTKSNLERAICILGEGKLSGLYMAILNSIAIYNGEGPIPTSASSFFCQGRIYVQNVGDKFPLFYYLDMLVHEEAHQHFNIINNLTSLIADYNQTLLSYAKNQKRPIYGILHGVFVLYRLISFYLDNSDLLKGFTIPYNKQDYNNYLHARFFQIPFNYAFRLEIYKQKLAKTYSQLIHSTGLTAEGKEFINCIYNSIFID